MWLTSMFANPLIKRFIDTHLWWIVQAIAYAVFAFMIGKLIGKGGMMVAIVLIAIPIVIFFLAFLLMNPGAALDGSMIVGFFSAGITRYVVAPWGLAMDGFLFIGWLALFFKKFRDTDWSPLRNDVMVVAMVWYGLVILELANPEMNGVECWFYAMRGNGFYQVLSFGLVFMLYREQRYLDRFLSWTIILSLIGTAWGFRQMITGVDEAEAKWLYVDGFALTHMLAGVLRVFSFYSDAGQFGASQAHVFVVCAIIALGPVSTKQRIWYGIGAIFCFIGFAVSGTRGALAVPALGAVTYLVVSKNFKILILGLAMLGSVFYVLKYTKAFQSVEQVKRMRTAMDPEDASFQVRLKNQRTFARHLATRPFGGGIGAAGYWGFRFKPNSLLANTATDSYYVKIWAETGIIGICLHLFMFGWFVGKGGQVVWNLKDPVLRVKIAGLYSGMTGIMFASYGNQVYSQLPTGILMGISIPLIFMAPHFDKHN
jgi:hypothetical protein